MPACKTKIEFAGQKTSLLTWTQDMQAWSFSLPASFSCPFKVANDVDDICNSCYAEYSRYNMPNVMNAQLIRFFWIKDLLIKDKKLAIDTFIQAIKDNVKNGYFRGHDAGDFFNPEYVDMWYEVCKALPDVKFWFPTRSYRAEQLKWLVAFTFLNKLPNVSVRSSAIKFDDMPPDLHNKGFAAGSTAISSLDINLKDVQVCPKSKNKTDCETENCRYCWSKKGKVAYLVHTHMGRNEIKPVSEKIKNTRMNMFNNFIALTIKSREVVV